MARKRSTRRKSARRSRGGGKGFPIGTVAAAGAVAVGAYLIWRQLSAPRSAMISTTPVLGPVVGGQLPGPSITDVSAGLAPSDLTQPQLPTMPTITGPEPGAPTEEIVMERLGNPKPGSTIWVGGDPKMIDQYFPPFKGTAGPKQKKCLKSGGVWTGPTGKKFCVMQSV